MNNVGNTTDTYNVPVKITFEAYDALPRELRDALKYASRNYSSIRMQEFLNLSMKDRCKVFYGLKPEVQNFLRPWLKKVL